MKNWLILILGRHSKRVRLWYYKKSHGFSPWGFVTYIKDMRP